MSKNSFSREYIFYKCNTLKHCLELTLYSPIQIKGKLSSQIYVLDVEPNDDERRKSLIRNCATLIDSYGKLNVLAFMDGMEITDGIGVEIDTGNIEEIQLYH